MAKKQSGKKTGGSCAGAADFGVNTYGDMNSQHAASTGGNVIAMNYVKGGKRKSKKSKSRKSPRKSRRNRSSRRH